jgi:hypothetical protein
MIERGFGFNKKLDSLRRLDDALLRRFPALLSLCRYAAIMLKK